MNGRRQHYTLIVGEQGCGKSTFVDEINKVYTKSLKPIINIIPDDGEEIFEQYDTVDVEEAKYIKTGIYNVIVSDDKDFIHLMEFENGLANVDDARAYLKSRSENFRRWSMRRRQANRDVNFICHGLSEVPPSNSTFVTDIVLFSVADESDRWTIDHKDKFIPLVKNINEIALTQDPHYYEHYELKSGRIIDPLTKQIIA